MKKFLICALLLGALFAGWQYAVYHLGFHIDLDPDAPVTAVFRAEGDTFVRETAAGPEPVIVRGVQVSSSMPAHFAADFAPEEGDYLRWLTAIGEMGANTVRAASIMDDDFYNALYTYNTTHADPLYLIQGTSVPDAVNYGAGSAADDAFAGKLTQDGMDLVDILHGRKRITMRTDGGGTGRYTHDLSPWVLGYLVGDGWGADVLAYTDHEAGRRTAYQGEYFSTASDATAFEAVLAQVMDTITGYESKKYKVQRPIGFANSPETDALQYKEWAAAQLGKYVWVDAEHVLPTEQMEAGTFAAYHLYDFCPDFAAYLTDAQRAALAEEGTGVDASAAYGGYLTLMARHHTMPVLAFRYGISSARGVISEASDGPLTEREQGEQLVRIARAVEDAGWTGGCITGWQDQWERRTWNTAYATDLGNGQWWHDVQTDGQSYGLMAFQTPGCVIDGVPDEWTADDVIRTEPGLTLSAREDPEGLSLLLTGPNVGPGRRLYVPIDTTQESGSTRCQSPALRFSRAADFLLIVDGTEDTRLLVQARYDAARAGFESEITGEDAYIHWPDADDPAFVPIRMPLENHTLLETVTPENIAQRRLPVWETGRLTAGCGDPDSPAYDSRADFCFGDGCVEIRLPWGLLNFSNPAEAQVHSDYYAHYGVTSHRIGGCWLGASAGGDAPIAMERLALHGWNRVTYTERLKQSYEVLQAAWRE